MIVVCAYCGELLGSLEGDGTSHGICPPCSRLLLATSARRHYSSDGAAGDGTNQSAREPQRDQKDGDLE